MILRVGDPATTPPVSALRRAATGALRACLKSPAQALVLASAAVASTLAVSWLLWSVCRPRAGRRQRRRRIVGSMGEAATSEPVRPASPGHYPGLENVGNSCYLNATLQSLAALSLPIEPVSPFHIVLGGLLDQLCTPGRSILSVQELIRAMGGSGLSPDQQDAHEFLQAILGVLSRPGSVAAKSPSGSGSTENIYPHQPDSPLLLSKARPWEAWEVQSVLCGSCGRISDSGARISHSSMLVVPPSATLQEALRLAFVPDHLSDYVCAHCRRPVSSALASRGIVRWPQILIIHVQRTLPFGKDETRMHFPLRFCAPHQDLHSQHPSAAATRVIANQAHRPSYELAAVVEHRGGLRGGHYTAYRRVVVRENRHQWLFCSDAHVREVSLDQVLAAQAYILFYVVAA